MLHKRTAQNTRSKLGKKKGRMRSSADAEVAECRAKMASPQDRDKQREKLLAWSKFSRKARDKALC